MTRLRWGVVIGCAGLALALGAVASFPFHPVPLVRADQPWKVSGGFAKGGAGDVTAFDTQASLRERRLDLWRSWTGSYAHTGELKSPVFRAPRRMQCFLSGYPGRAGLSVYLERERDHQRFALTVPGGAVPAEFWRRYYWTLPDGWRGEFVRLCASDQSKESWVGVSTPLAFSHLELFHRQLPGAMRALIRLLLSYGLFLLPGFGVTALLCARRDTLVRYPLMTAIAISAACGYVAFYAFLPSHLLGKLVVYGVYLASLACLGIAWRNRARMRQAARSMAEPLLLVLAAAACYYCWTFLFIDPRVGSDNLDGRFFTRQMPGDNIIPLIFAGKVYDRTPIYPFCCGEWRSSDRPPLQTGIFLLQRPLMARKDVPLAYQGLATELQCLWIAGVWSFLLSLGVARHMIRRVWLLLIFSGIVFYESVYTWPKFLTATLVLFAVSVVVGVIRAKRQADAEDVIVAALCLGLALVSHPGSLFSLPGLLIVMLVFRQYFPWWRVAASAAIMASFALPWTAYQKFIDPPGDKLFKVHFAGDLSSNSNTAWQDVRRMYHLHTWREIAALRWSNIKGIAGYTPFDTFGYHDQAPNDPMSAVEWNRQLQERYLWNAFAGLNIGWLAAIWVWLRKKPLPVSRYGGAILLAAALNALLWCLVEFGPNFALVAHYSFADFLAVSVVLALFILEWPAWVAALVLAIQLFNFLCVWVCHVPYGFQAWAGPAFAVNFQWPMLLFGIVFGLSILGYLVSSEFRNPPIPLCEAGSAPSHLEDGGRYHSELASRESL